MKKQFILSLVVIFMMLLASCSILSGKRGTGASYQYTVPVQTDDGWETAHIDDVNIDEKLLTEMVQNIFADKYGNINSVLIFKDGKLVFEEYFPDKYFGIIKIPHTRNSLNRVYSVSKSFTSTLIGIAIDKGMIKDVNEDFVSIFPKYKELLGGHGKKLKLKHLLSMTAGFDWDEISISYGSSSNPYWEMLGLGGLRKSRHAVFQYILSRPVVKEPGNEFAYNGGLSILLGKIIEKRSSLKVRDFAKKHLFEPLGIKKFGWGYWDEKEEVPTTDSGLYLRPRDMAKLGYLYTNNGKWKGKQIISAKWIEEATKKHINVGISPSHISGYGYQWWVCIFDIDGKKTEIPAALGYGGQAIAVFPDQDMVVVFTAENQFLPRLKVHTMLYDMIHNYVLPAALTSN